MADPHDISGEPSQLKLGKKAARFDRRTIQLKSILKVLPPIPPSFDVDSQYPFPIDNPMFRNGGEKSLGDCVIAARGHMTRRFESTEQKKLIFISDNDVVNEYFKESDGSDYGLVMLDSLKVWKNSGWPIGGRKLLCLTIGGQTYDIYGFAQFHPKDRDEVKASIAFLNGAYIGLQLPMSAQTQLASNQIWDLVSGPDGEPASWGGHCVYVPKYDEIGPYCVTWGAIQQMTWAFFEACCDEAYAICDNRDNFLTDSPVNVEALDKILDEITA